jgi:tRNA-2-methylthio-N6-dimethylallyladenosine synthase
MEYVKYNFGYMYSYSERPEHWQEEKWKMTLPETKTKITGNCRFTTKHAWFRSEFIGQTVEVLVEKVSKNKRIFRKKFTKYYRGFQKKIIKLGLL